MKKKFTAKSNSDLKFWVEPNSQYFPANSERLVTFYIVVAQMKGYDVTEAYSDWFKYEKDAEHMAKQLADES